MPDTPNIGRTEVARRKAYAPDLFLIDFDGTVADTLTI